MKRIAMLDGMKIAYQHWGVGNQKQILMLHGWLDNSNSFKHLGPFLADKGFSCIALDHIGHGRSTHLPPSGNYTSIKAVSYVKEFIQNLEMANCHILGHSMGANISFVFAGCFPELVDKLVMIDGLGPPSHPAKSTCKNLRKAVESAEKVARKTTLPKIYKSFKDAVDARIHSVTTYPGEQYLTREAAKLLVGRGTYLANANTVHLTPSQLAAEATEAELDLQLDESGPVRFRHDPRLVLPTFQYHTNDQVLSYAAGITAKSLIISAEKGWPAGNAHAEYMERKKVLMDKGILTHVTLPGSHHLHIDPESAPLVATTVSDFLLKA